MVSQLWFTRFKPHIFNIKAKQRLVQISIISSPSWPCESQFQQIIPHNHFPGSRDWTAFKPQWPHRTSLKISAARLLADQIAPKHTHSQQTKSDTRICSPHSIHTKNKAISNTTFTLARKVNIPCSWPPKTA